MGQANGRPDIDNLVKAALDAINSIVVVDDAQVTEIAARKAFGVDAKTVLTVSSLSDEAQAQMTSDLVRLLQEVAAAESNADIDEILARAIEAAAGLPPHRAAIRYASRLNILPASAARLKIC